VAQIQFKGKTFVQNHHLMVKFHELIPVKSKSLTKKVSLHDNLIIHGDNLKALKSLVPLYAGKIKCIYIDPPYNTGNENWIYNDNVNKNDSVYWVTGTFSNEILRIAFPLAKHLITTNAIAKRFHYEKYEFAIDSIRGFFHLLF